MPSKKSVLLVVYLFSIKWKCVWHLYGLKFISGPFYSPHRLKRSAFGSSKPTVSTVETVTLTVFSIPRLYRSSSAAPALPGKFCFLIFVLAVLFKTAGRCCQRALQIRQVTQQVNIINHHQYLDYTLFRFSHKFSQSKTLFFILHSKSCLLLQHKKETP